MCLDILIFGSVLVFRVRVVSRPPVPQISIPTLPCPLIPHELQGEELCPVLPDPTTETPKCQALSKQKIELMNRVMHILTLVRALPYLVFYCCDKKL